MEALEGLLIIATDWREHKVHVLNGSSFSAQHSFQITFPYRCAAKPSSALVAVASHTPKKLHIFDAVNRSEVRVVDGIPALSVAFSSSGRLLAVGTTDGNVVVFNTRDEVQDWSPIAILRGLSSWVWDVQFSADETLLVAGENKKVIVWQVNVQQNKFLKNQQFTDGLADFVFGVAIHPTDNRIVAVCNNKTITEWRMEGRRYVNRIFDVSRTTLLNNSPIRFSPDGSLVAAGSAVFRSSDWSRVRTFVAGSVDCVEFCADGQHILVSNTGGVVQLYSVTQDAPIRPGAKIAHSNTYGLCLVRASAAAQPQETLAVANDDFPEASLSTPPQVSDSSSENAALQTQIRHLTARDLVEAPCYQPAESNPLPVIPVDSPPANAENLLADAVAEYEGSIASLSSARDHACHAFSSRKQQIMAALESAEREVLQRIDAAIRAKEDLAAQGRERMAELASRTQQALSKLSKSGLAQITAADVVTIFVHYGIQYDSGAVNNLKNVPALLNRCKSARIIRDLLHVPTLGDAVRVLHILNCAQGNQQRPPVARIEVDGEQNGVRGWSVRQVGQWVQSKGFGEFAQPFVQQRVAGDVLGTLDDNDLLLWFPSVDASRHLDLLDTIAELSAIPAVPVAIEDASFQGATLLRPISQSDLERDV